MKTTRRRFLAVSAALAAGTALPSSLLAQASVPPAPPRQPPPPKPPALPPDQVQAVVGQAHRNLAEVRRLVEAVPLLVNACWDWGGGDFETPLEAAAHTGRREIAEYLLAQGARPSLFAAGMLGQLELVKCFLTLDPEAHRVRGPHGFTLMHCVDAGGERARPVREWLLAQGVPDETHRPLPFIWPEGARPPGG